MSQTVEPLVKFLDQMRGHGKTHVGLDAEAKGMLREWFVAAKKQTKVVVEAAPATVAESMVTKEVPEVQPEKVMIATEPVLESPESPQYTAEPKVAAPVESVKPVQQVVTPKTTMSAPLDNLIASPIVGDAVPTIEGTTKAERIESLRQQATRWKDGKLGLNLGEKMVFSAGSEDAKVVFVGEAPGAEDEQQGEPFVGPAGQKLDAIIKAMGLSREEVYVTNIVKYRPTPEAGSASPINRAPDLTEMEAFVGFVKAEVEIIQPQVVVALGTSSARGLLKEVNSTITALRGRFHEFNGVSTVVTYHPSFLLKDENDMTKKRKLWEDMLLVMEKLGMEISAKQQRYFRPRG